MYDLCTHYVPDVRHRGTYVGHRGIYAGHRGTCEAPMYTLCTLCTLYVHIMWYLCTLCTLYVHIMYGLCTVEYSGVGLTHAQ